MANPTIAWLTKVITVPQSFLTFVSAGKYSLDVNLFRNALKDIEDSSEGMSYPDTHSHSTAVTLSGVTYARQFVIVNGYTVTFESTGTPYQVECIGANHNILDVKNVNDVSLIIGNSAGLIAVDTGGGGAGPTAAQIAAQVRVELAAELAQLTKVSKIHGVGVPLVVTPTSRTAGDINQTITTVGDTTTVSAT
jgi:hypothetical protein